jgi:membrane associated rhomboid family serine protease
MMIPWGTDAPIYHWPIVTGTMILVNVGVFIGEVQDVVGPEWALALGDGLHPIQWLTHNFLHVGIGHLIGNMIFLWAFGIIVEGKLGALPFLGVYLAIGLAHGAAVQILMLGLEEPTKALGASAVVFGLLAICLVWAPKNEISCHVILAAIYRIFYFQWDVPIYALALFYIGQEVVWLVIGGMTGLSIGTAIGHLSGGIWGFLFGCLLVKMNWVDCEGWDMFSLMAKRRKLAKDWRIRGERLDRQRREEGRPRARHVASEETGVAAPPSGEKVAAAVRKVRDLIDLGDFDAAQAAFDRSARTMPDWPAEPDLIAMIKAMHAQKAWVPSVPLLQFYCRRFSDRADVMRLKLAQILIRDRQRPAHALRVLGEIREGSLPADLDTICRQLARKAQTMLEEGVLELEEDY